MASTAVVTAIGCDESGWSRCSAPAGRRGLPGGGLAAMRRTPGAQLHMRGRLLAAEAPRGAHHLVGLPRRGRHHRRGHVPRSVRDVGRVLPEGGKGARGGRARRARVP